MNYKNRLVTITPHNVATAIMINDYEERFLENIKIKNQYEDCGT